MIENVFTLKIRTIENNIPVLSILLLSRADQMIYCNVSRSRPLSLLHLWWSGFTTRGLALYCELVKVHYKGFSSLL